AGARRARRSGSALPQGDRALAPGVRRPMVQSRLDPDRAQRASKGARGLCAWARRRSRRLAEPSRRATDIADDLHRCRGACCGARGHCRRSFRPRPRVAGGASGPPGSAGGRRPALEQLLPRLSGPGRSAATGGVRRACGARHRCRRSAVACAAGTALQPRWTHTHRVRFGVLSRRYRGRYFKRWITDLDRTRFEVFVYHLFPGMDEVARAIAHRADCFREYGGSRARPSVVAPAIRDDALDVLVYPELGMDACSFALAALRLAPRQYAGWGHPVTTGHATIDAFISSAAMEPEGAQAHYVEPLVTLPGIGTRYEKPVVPGDASRA